MDRLKRIIAETGGSEIAEAALVIPIFFLVLLGIYWFGRAFNTYATINHAAREGALAATMSYLRELRKRRDSASHRSPTQ